MGVGPSVTVLSAVSEVLYLLLLFSGLRFHPATLLQSDLSCFAQFFTKWNNFDVDGFFGRICVFVTKKI